MKEKAMKPVKAWAIVHKDGDVCKCSIDGLGGHLRIFETRKRVRESVPIGRISNLRVVRVEIRPVRKAGRK